MLTMAHRAGASAALARFGIKQADAVPPQTFGAKALDFAKGVGRTMVGHPEKVFNRSEWKNPTGMFNAKNILWPSVKGPGTGLGNWMGRAGTGLAAYGAYKALRGEGGDPREGRLTNALGEVGSAAGSLLSYPIAGMLGAPVLGDMGRRIGVGLGRTLGSRAAPPRPPQQMPQPQQFEGYP